MKLDGSTAFGFQRVLEERRQSHSTDGRDGVQAVQGPPGAIAEQLPPRPRSSQRPPTVAAKVPIQRGWMGKLAAGTASSASHERSQKIAYRNLRTNESIVQQLDRWRQCATSVAEGGEPGISKEEYIRISRLIFKAAVRPFDDARAQEAATCDWRDDAGDVDVMPEARFMDCVFEVRLPSQPAFPCFGGCRAL